MDVLLCGDIGGTHTRLALIRPGHPHRPLASEVFASREFSALEPLLQRFLSGQRGSRLGGLRLRAAAFGIPGPVSAASKDLWMVNLPWRIRVPAVAKALGVPRVRFLNDFAAVALAVPHLKPENLHAIGTGVAQSRAPIGVIGAGTGLGEGFLVWHGTGYVTVSSEGGHTDFAPRTPREIRLLEYLRERTGPVPWERVLSGPGLVNLVEFLRDVEDWTLPAELVAALGSSTTRTSAPSLVTRLGQGPAPDPVCAEAIELFCTLYGAEAGNLALKAVATGGIYLAGGVALHLLDALDRGGFRTAFAAKQGFGELLSTVPTWVITHPNPGLLGAAIAAQADLVADDTAAGKRSTTGLTRRREDAKRGTAGITRRREGAKKKLPKKLSRKRGGSS
jgi:glucokinase